MDVMRLDPDTFLPIELVEGYKSMIWTERFAGPGEFEFKTAQIFGTLDVLREGTFVSLRDTSEVMMVETRSVEEDSDGNPELTITGRTVETYLEHRVTQPAAYGTPNTPKLSYTLHEQLLLILWNHLVNQTGQDLMNAWFNTYLDPAGALPNVVISETVTDPFEYVDQFWFDAGYVYHPFKDLIDIGYFGIRGIRPPTVGTVISVDTSPDIPGSNRGIIIRSPDSAIDSLRLDIYNGKDRTLHQTALSPVIFHYDSGHLEKPKYLFSTKDEKTIAFGNSSRYHSMIPPPGGDLYISGFDRKVLYVDAGTLDAELDDINPSIVENKSWIELKQHRAIRLFDSEISPVSPYKYGKDYFLGDRISLLARYGFEETMLVSEYVRTEDNEGDRGYPGLSAIPS